MSEAEKYLIEQEVIFDIPNKGILFDKYLLISLLNGFAGRQLKKKMPKHDAFRHFIRSNHLLDKLEKWLKDNKY